MKEFLKLANGVYGLALVLCAMFMQRVEFIEIAQPQGSDGWQLIRFHLFLTGAACVFAARSGPVNLIAASFAPALVMLNGWIFWSALTGADTDKAWTVLFGVAALLLGARLAFVMVAAEEPPSEPEVDAPPEAEGLWVDERFGEIGAIETGNPFSSILMLMLAVPAGLVSVAVIIAYSLIVRNVIVDDAEPDFSILIEQANAAFQESLPQILAFLAVYAAIFIVQYLFERYTGASDGKEVADANRALSETERRYIQNSMEALHAYLTEQRYGRFFGMLQIVFIAGLIASFTIAPMLLILAEGAAADILFRNETEGLDVIVRNGPALIGAGIAGFLSGIAIYWSALQMLGARMPALGEYLHARLGWNTMNQHERAMPEHAKIFARFVRLRRLGPETGFDPRGFLYAAFREREGLVYKATGFLVIVTLAVFVFDLCWREIVHANGVRYSPYWSLALSDAELDEVERVEVSCFLFNPGDDGVRKLSVEYRLRTEGRFNVDVADSLYLDEPDELARLEALDARLSDAGVPVTRKKKAGLIFGERSGFADDCAALIRERLEPETAARLLRLLRVEEGVTPPPSP